MRVMYVAVLCNSGPEPGLMAVENFHGWAINLVTWVPRATSMLSVVQRRSARWRAQFPYNGLCDDLMNYMLEKRYNYVNCVRKWRFRDQQIVGDTLSYAERYPDYHYMSAPETGVWFSVHSHCLRKAAHRSSFGLRTALARFTIASSRYQPGETKPAGSRMTWRVCPARLS